MDLMILTSSCFSSSGRIKVHNPQTLADEVLGKYFRHNKYASFQRQLNYFGFRKLAGKGKMSPCAYVNDAASGDLKSLLNIRRKATVSSSKRKKPSRMLSKILMGDKRLKKSSNMKRHVSKRQKIVDDNLPSRLKEKIVEAEAPVTTSIPSVIVDEYCDQELDINGNVSAIFFADDNKFNFILGVTPNVSEGFINQIGYEASAAMDAAVNEATQRPTDFFENSALLFHDQNPYHTADGEVTDDSKSISSCSMGAACDSDLIDLAMLFEPQSQTREIELIDRPAVCLVESGPLSPKPSQHMNVQVNNPLSNTTCKGISTPQLPQLTSRSTYMTYINNNVCNPLTSPAFKADDTGVNLVG